jgi:hypothetical protein
MKKQKAVCQKCKLREVAKENGKFCTPCLVEVYYSK